MSSPDIMRILHCIPNFVSGGAERRLTYLLPELAIRGHDVHVAFLHGGPNLARLESSDVHLHRLHSRSNYDPRILLHLVRLIRHVRPDVVQTWVTQMNILGGIAAGFTRTPRCLSETSTGRNYPRTWKIWLRDRVAAGAGAIVSNSAGGDAYWQARLPNKPRYVIPNSLPLQEIAAAAPAAPAALADLGVDPAGRLVLYVGRFVPLKNVGNLVRALVTLMDDEAIVGVLCGEGPTRPIVEQWVHQLGFSDRLLLPGFVANVWPLMKRAEVFVSVSDYEGRPNAVLEAMACGCPLVVSDIPAHREFLDKRSALFVNPRDLAEIARAIRRTLSDPTAARRRAAIAKEKTAGWTISSMARQYERVYRDVLALRARE